MNASESLKDIVDAAYNYNYELSRNPKLGGLPLAAFLKNNRVSPDERSIEWTAYFDRSQRGYSAKEARIIEKRRLYTKLEHKLYVGYYEKVFYISEVSQSDNKFEPDNNFPNAIRAYQGLINEIRLSQNEDKEELKKQADKLIMS